MLVDDRAMLTQEYRWTLGRVRQLLYEVETVIGSIEEDPTPASAEIILMAERRAEELRVKLHQLRHTRQKLD